MKFYDIPKDKETYVAHWQSDDGRGVNQDNYKKVGYKKVTVKANFSGKASVTTKSPAKGNYAAANKTITVKVNPSKTTLSSVKNASPKSMKVKWKKNASAGGYQIRYSRSAETGRLSGQ